MINCNTLYRYDFAWGRSAGEGWNKDSIIAAVRDYTPHPGSLCPDSCCKVLEDDAQPPVEAQLTKTLSL